MEIAEAFSVSNPYRSAYQDGIRAIIAARRREMDLIREQTATPLDVAQNREVWRNRLRELLGWPLNCPCEGIPELQICEEKRYGAHARFLRLQIQVLPGLPFYGILFLPDAQGPLPLIIAQHGGGGTPELTADMHGENNYNHMTARLLDRGCAVFAPQLLLWEENSHYPGIPSYSLPNERGKLNAQLRQAGGGIAALEVFALTRALDALSALSILSRDRVGMIGLSYGGFYTQLLAALDTRIRAAATCAFFNSRYAYCWDDFAWKNAGSVMLDAEICALIAPRALCVHVGRNDHVFSVATALNELERLKPFFAEARAEQQLKIIVSDADHRLTQNGEEIDFLLSHLQRTGVSAER